MNKSFQLFLLLALGAAASAAPHPFENEIAAFEAADKTSPPPQRAILFIGSSSIRKWTTLAQDFPGLKVINRGFGGSHLSDSIYYFDRIVTPYKPKMIVLYAGSNDIDAGKTPETVVDDCETFVRKVEAALPGTRIAYISINTSPLRWREVEKVKQANRQIAAFMAKKENRVFIDTFPGMLDSGGKPRPELYVWDRLHMNSKGYAIWTSIIAPYLAKAD